jgi:phosphoenolpyruvate synthase/pyruvate phosphate dikinase
MDDLDQLQFEEAFALIQNKKNVKELCSARRQATFFFHMANERTTVSEGSVAEQHIHEIVPEEDKPTETSEIRGKTGFRGHVIAHVHKILTSSEIKTFKEGCVLVTVYTAPEFVPAMKKAAAIITDTGGITSHAAIVARELGKPCIVATKIGTKALHTGDLIEVKAHEGIIRILKRRQDI